MGQQQIKIPTTSHIVTMTLNNQHILSLTVHTCNQNRSLTLQYHQEYMFLELPEQVQQEFQTMKGLFKNVCDSQGMCCTAGNGCYRVQFEKGKLIIIQKYTGRKMVIKVQSVENNSEETMTIQLEEKVISLQDRLQRQLSTNRKIHKVSSPHIVNKIDAAKNHTVPLQKHFFKLQNGFYLSLQNLNANIMSSINQSALKSIIVTHLNLIGNNLTSIALCRILSLNWDNLEKLQLDDNLIQKTDGLETLQKLSELSITKNLLQIEAAQHLSKTQFQQLKLLKISFMISKKTQKCWNILWQNGGKNFPKLQKLIIVHNKILPQITKRNYEIWKITKTENDKERQVIYEIKDFQKISNNKISALNKINSLKDYPEME